MQRTAEPGRGSLSVAAAGEAAGARQGRHRTRRCHLLHDRRVGDIEVLHAIRRQSAGAAAHRHERGRHAAGDLEDRRRRASVADIQHRIDIDERAHARIRAAVALNKSVCLYLPHAVAAVSDVDVAGGIRRKRERVAQKRRRARPATVTARARRTGDGGYHTGGTDLAHGIVVGNIQVARRIEGECGRPPEPGLCDRAVRVAAGADLAR